MASKAEFVLPRGWYRKTAAKAIEELEGSLGPLTPKNAWLFLYCCVVWKQEMPAESGDFYLHLNDRLKSKAGKELATRAEQFLIKQLPSRAKLDSLIDQIGKRYGKERFRQGVRTAWQRNNITGNSLEATLQVLISRLTDVLPSRSPRLNTLQGFELAPVGYHARPDLALFSARDFRMLISTKWTLRKERIGTYLHEAYFYKRRRPDLQIAFVVAEFNPNILSWLVNDGLVDRVYHVGLPLLLDVHAPWVKKDVDPGKLVGQLLRMSSGESKSYSTFAELSQKIFPIEQLFTDIAYLKTPADRNAVDPEVESVSDEDDSD